MRDVIRDIYTRLWDETRVELGAAWDGVTDEEKHLLRRSLRRMAELQVNELAGDTRDAAEWAHVEAQLLNIQSAGQGRTRTAVFAVLKRILTTAAGMIGGTP